MNIKYVHFLVVILWLQQIDASVRISQTVAHAYNNSYQCGDEILLTCKISNHSVTMSWQNDSSNIPFAECFFDTCNLDPDVANKYEFSADTNTGTLNLTFNASSFHNGTTYRCSDGLNSEDFLFLTTDFRTNFIETNKSQLKAVSGCLSSSANVEFKWKKIKANDTEESDYNTSSSNEQYSSDKTTCRFNAECGGPDMIKRIMSIEEEQGGPDDYHLKVIMSYDGVDIESSPTNTTYKLKKIGIAQKTENWCSKSCLPALVSLLVLPVFSILQAIYALCNKKREGKSTMYKFLVFIPIVGIFVMLKCHRIAKCFVTSEQEDRLEVIEVERTSITVSWKRCTPEGQKHMYILRCSNNIPEKLIDDNGETTMECTVQNLHQSTYYELNLKCVNGSLEVLKEYKPMKVRTYGVPEAPSLFRVERNKVSESSIMVKWEPKLDGGKPQTFILTYSANNRTILTIEIKPKGERSMSYTLKGLSEGTYYDLELRSKNDNGWSTTIQPIKERTLGKPEPPVNLSAENITEKSMKVKWKKGFNGGCPQWFNVCNLDSKQKMCEMILESQDEDSGQCQCNLTNLTPSTFYRLQVSSENRIGSVHCLKPLVIRTNGKPYTPKQFKCIRKHDVTDTSITVRWTAGSDGGYKQNFASAISGEGLEKSYTIMDDGRVKTFHKKWNGLKESTDYVITLYARNEFGESAKQQLHIRTSEHKVQHSEEKDLCVHNKQQIEEYDVKSNGPEVLNVDETKRRNEQAREDNTSINSNEFDRRIDAQRMVSSYLNLNSPNTETYNKEDGSSQMNDAFNSSKISGNEASDFTRISNKQRGISTNFDDPCFMNTPLG